MTRLVILVNLQDKVVEPYTTAFAQNVVFGTASNYDFETSYQWTWLSGDVVGWFTIPLSSTVCDSSNLAKYAKEAATAAGVTAAKFPRRIIHLSVGGTGSVPCLAISDGSNWKQIAIGANAI